MTEDLYDEQPEMIPFRKNGKLWELGCEPDPDARSQPDNVLGIYDDLRVVDLPDDVDHLNLE
eukprot:3237401-Alexandrium_andersonii.AAC.1